MATANPYPVSYDVTPQLTGRNRLTALFRIILAIPQLLIVSAFSYVAEAIAVIAWVAIVITGNMPRGLWNLGVGYMRWRTRVNAYVLLHRDEYPPFSMDEDAGYQASYVSGEFPQQRNRLTVLLRLIWMIPIAIYAAIIGFIAAILYLIMWLLIIITGSAPAGLYNFTVGALRVGARLEAYMLLLTDEYPPFSMD
jgi:Domain of unknown function (DUF4389)